MIDVKSLAFGFKLHKSAGVPVSAVVHRHLTDANRARDQRNWGTAAKGYEAALVLDDALVHIWIQLGHARKELGEFDLAERAYRRAGALAPASAEAPLHLGHLCKRRGDRIAAERFYLQAARLDPNHPDVLSEIQGLDVSGIDIPLGHEVAPAWQDTPTLAAAARRARETLGELRSMLGDRADHLPLESRDLFNGLDGLIDEVVAATPVPERSGPALVFDVSDLISYFRNARLPTGIQRVQIEVISGALLRGHRQIKICCFLEQRDDWLEIPPAAFLALCRLSLSDGNRFASDWTAALLQLQRLLRSSDPLVFPEGAYLINLGTSWWLQNYFLFVRKAKAEHGIRYVPFVHDLIPIKAREHCTKELTQDFISWALGAFEHADFFLVNSEATKRDLREVAGHLGHTLPEDHVGVIRLDADFRKEPAAVPDSTLLQPLDLARTPFVLFVSTIESRKNHLCAFEAWSALMRQRGASRVPKLVCVGNRGWLNDAVYAYLEADAALAGKVVMLSGLSDASLAALYRACLFTIYPSLYEGWGLPVTESLCYGKVPVVSNAASLPEAAGSFGVYFESGSSKRLAEVVAPLMFDAGARRVKEAHIAKSFRPRSWADLSEEMVAHLTAWETKPHTGYAPLKAQLGAYHPIVRHFETRVWPGMRSAEGFRVGDGWWGPDDFGCWTKAQGGKIELSLPSDHGPLRVHFKLHGLPNKDCHFSLSVGISQSINGHLRPGQERWVSLTLSAAEQSKGIIRARLYSQDTTDLAEITASGDRRVVSVGLAGFFICEVDDSQARLAFVEAVALDNLADIGFGRPSNNYNIANFADISADDEMTAVVSAIAELAAL